MPVYATVDNYIDYTGNPVPAEIPPRTMVRASQSVDKALVGAIYDTDVNGLPIDTVLIAALRDATCAAARPLVEGWDMPIPTPPGCCPDCQLTTEAFDILRGVGLLPIRFLRMRG